MNSIYKKISNDYFKLFVKREGVVVLGKHYVTLWLLTAVLFATFLAIAFSNASMKYLSDKMNDPFIRWMDIPNQMDGGKFEELELAFGDPEVMEAYDFGSYQADYYQAYMFFGADGHDIQYFRVRFFEDMQTDLMRAILAEENRVGDETIASVEDIPEESCGLILTQKALQKLGYDEEAVPSFIDIMHDAVDADTLGFRLTSDHMAHVPLPVLGVVKRLPSGVDIVASRFLIQQDYNDDTYPFNLNNPDYASSLHYFVPSDCDGEALKADLNRLSEELSSVPAMVDDISFWKPELTCFRAGDYLSLVGVRSPIPALEAAAINDEILASWADKGVYRVYDYAFSPYELPIKSYLSVYFNSLDHIREFENWVSTFGVKIDMSQVNSKENFNAVSILATILSSSIIIFAIVCIILFIVNLLQSYFQKVKRNLGTFKAFGVSNARLILVYVLIVGVIVLASVLLALFLAFLVQEGLILGGVLKDGTYSYFSLWSGKTFATALIILGSSVCTVYLVMRQLLRHTPGDLIYDRQ